MTRGEKERAEMQRLAEDCRAKGDADGERKYSRLIWRSAKKERDSKPKPRNGKR